MATFAPKRIDETRLRELDELTQHAWAQYRDELQGLAGKEYEDAEHHSWDRLQRELDALVRERSELGAVEGPSPDPAGTGATG